MTTKLYVGGLAWQTTDDSLKNFFGGYNSVIEAVVVRDSETGRSRGHGTVVFENAGDADAAEKELNDTELDGRKVRLSKTPPNTVDGKA